MVAGSALALLGLLAFPLLFFGPSPLSINVSESLPVGLYWTGSLPEPGSAPGETTSEGRTGNLRVEVGLRRPQARLNGDTSLKGRALPAPRRLEKSLLPSLETRSMWQIQGPSLTDRFSPAARPSCTTARAGQCPGSEAGSSCPWGPPGSTAGTAPGASIADITDQCPSLGCVGNFFLFW